MVRGCLVRTGAETSAVSGGPHLRQHPPNESSERGKPPGNRSLSRATTLCAYVAAASELQRLRGRTRATCDRAAPRPMYPSGKERLLGQASSGRLAPVWTNLRQGQYWTWWTYHLLRYEVVAVSGGERGWKDGDGRRVFSCWFDCGAVSQFVDVHFPPGNPLAHSDQIPNHPPRLGEYPQSLAQWTSQERRVPTQVQATWSLPREGVNEAAAYLDVDEERQHRHRCGSQARL